MQRMRFVLALLLVAGCSAQEKRVKSVDTRPGISISGSSTDAALYVDGVKRGRARDFQEPNQLDLAPGTHRVSLMESGYVNLRPDDPPAERT